MKVDNGLLVKIADMENAIYKSVVRKELSCCKDILISNGLKYKTIKEKVLYRAILKHVKICCSDEISMIIFDDVTDIIADILNVKKSFNKGKHVNIPVFITGDSNKLIRSDKTIKV